MAGKIFLLYLTCLFLVLDVCTTQQFSFTDLDLSIIRNFSKYLNSQNVVFLENEKSVGFTKSIKMFSRDNFPCGVINVKLLNNILDNNNSQINFFQRKTLIVLKNNVDLNSLLSKVILPHYLSWVVFKSYAYFPQLYIPMSSTVIFIKYTTRSISAKRVYHIKKGIKETVQTLWEWDLAESKMVYFPFESNKIRFQNVTMDMLVLNSKQSCKDLQGALLLKKLECAQQNLLEVMGERLNYSINVVECMNKEHPFVFPNGSYSDLLLKLLHKEVDFTGIGFVVRIQITRDFIELVWPTFVLHSRMYLKQGKLTGRWNSYLKPLESTVWFTILIWIALTGFLVEVIENFLENKLTFNFMFVLKVVMSILRSLKVFCNQAVEDQPKFSSLRIIYILELFVVLIFFQAYSGYLVSSLTVIVTRFPFQDLKGFFENKQYQVMTLQRGFHQFYFRKMIGVGQRENFMLPQDDLPETIQKAVDKLCVENYLAFADFRENFLNYDTLNCKILELPNPTILIYMGIAMPKYTPIKEYFKRELLYFKSTGIVQKLSFQLSTRKSFRDEHSPNEFMTVSMNQTFPVFVFLGMGILLSVVIFIVELGVYNKKKDVAKTTP